LAPTNWAARPGSRQWQERARIRQLKSLQFRAIEVTTLEHRRRQFENPGLIRVEREFLGVLRQRASRCDFILILILRTTAGPGDFWFHDNPGPRSGAGDREKNFNISKSDQTLKSFLDEVHEFKTGKWRGDTWEVSEELFCQGTLRNPKSKPVENQKGPE
jgi:hypothetical protein